MFGGDVKLDNIVGLTVDNFSTKVSPVSDFSGFGPDILRSSLIRIRLFTDASSHAFMPTAIRSQGRSSPLRLRSKVDLRVSWLELGGWRGGGGGGGSKGRIHPRVARVELACLQTQGCGWVHAAPQPPKKCRGGVGLPFVFPPWAATTRRWSWLAHFCQCRRGGIGSEKVCSKDTDVHSKPFSIN